MNNAHPVSQNQQYRPGAVQPVHAPSPIPRYVPPPATVRPPPTRPMPAAPLHVLLEFASNSVDRFLFPNNTILEFLPGFRACICSFLIVRKGGQLVDQVLYPPKDAAGKEVEYYQPMTVHFSANDSNVLSVLARVVRPQEEVQKYMQEVFKSAKRVEDSYLALRLPRKKGLEDGTG